MGSNPTLSASLAGERSRRALWGQEKKNDIPAIADMGQPFNISSIMFRMKQDASREWLASAPNRPQQEQVAKQHCHRRGYVVYYLPMMRTIARRTEVVPVIRTVRQRK